MSNRFRPAWLLVLAALSTSALAKAPETVNIGYQKANIFALLKYRGTLDESLKKQGIAVRWVEFPAGPQMLEGLNVGSIDLAATGDAPPAFAQAAQADLVYLAHSPANPKALRGAVKACRSGVRRCHLISYQENGALLQELFSRDGIGTQIVMESAEQIRRATINDIGGILELISPLEQQGILVRRSREQLEMEIDKFTIIQRDNTTIACAALYPFPEEKIGEMACVAVHPDYRSSSRGEVLLERIAAQARQMGLSKLFVLTTRSIHWFQERGFTPVDIDLLPESKKQMYNYQRRSKVLMADLA